MKMTLSILAMLFSLFGSTSVIVADPTTKAKATLHKKTTSRAAGAALNIIQSQSAGRNGRQIGIDKSVHTTTIYKNSPRTNNSYSPRITINKITVKSSDGAEFSFVIYPASPTVADDPLHIPFVLINNGRKSVYNLSCVVGTTDIERAGMTARGGTMSLGSPPRSVFASNDHMRIQIMPDDVTMMTGGALFTLGTPPPSRPSPPIMTTADISFILTYSLRPGGQIKRSKYSFSLMNNGKGTWDWSRE